MKKILFWIVIFICMADAAWAVTQEGGLFYLPEDTTTQHKDSTVQKRTFFKKFLDYFNDANKDKNHKKFDFSIIGGPHYSTDTKLGLGLVAAGLYSEMFPLLASICWGYAELISFRRTNTGWIILFIFIPFLPSFGE